MPSLRVAASLWIWIGIAVTTAAAERHVERRINEIEPTIVDVTWDGGQIELIQGCYSSGALAFEMPHLDGQMNGWANYFEPDGSYQGRLRFDHGEPIVRERFRNGKRVGEEETIGPKRVHFRSWWEDGTLRAEFTRQGESFDGPFHTYFDAGTVEKEGLYRLGGREGMWVLHHRNGIKKEEENYIGGRLDGPWTSWNEFGQPAEVGRYERGQRVGIWTRFVAGKACRSEYRIESRGSQEISVEGPMTCVDLEAPQPRP